jgi:RNA polymerase sigma-70 factor (ECF subfamily)
MLPASHPDQDPDCTLLDAFRRDGDREAMSRLLLKHAEVAFRLATRLTGNAADAEDAVQDALVRSMVHARSYHGKGTVRSWLLAIVANSCRERIRSEVSRRRREEAIAKEAPSGSEPKSDDLREHLNATLATLDDHYRLPLSMRYLDDMDFPDIAAALGGKEKSIRTRVSRGLEQLRDAIGKRGFPIATSGIVMALAEQPAAATAIDLAPLVHAAVAKGSTLPLATAAVWSLKTATVALALTGTIAAGSFAMVRPKPLPLAAVAGEALPDDAPLVARALGQPITVNVIGTLEDVLFALERALPRSCRISCTAPDALYTHLQRYSSTATTFSTPPDRRESNQNIDIQMANTPLRDVLDALCLMHGYRWIAGDRCIIIDKPLSDEARNRLVSTFASATDPADLAAAANALAGSVDINCLRPLLLAMANPGPRADAAGKAAGPLLGPFYSTMETSAKYWPSPLIAFAGDQDVRQAVLDAVRRKQEPRAELLKLAGQLRMTEVLDTCIDLVNRGFYHRFGIHAFLDHDSYVLDRPAAEALGWIGGERAVDTLIATITKPNYLYQPNDEAITALARLQDPKAVQPLLKYVEDEEAYGPMRGEMIEALGIIGDERAIEPIANVLMDSNADQFTRHSAPSALALIGTQSAIDRLFAGIGLGDSSWTVKHRVIAELGYLGGVRAETTLLDLITHSEGDSAPSAALARIRNPELIPRLSDLMKAERRERVYRNLARALSNMRLPAAEQVLLEVIPPADSPLLVDHIFAMGSTQITKNAVIRMVQPSGPPRQRRAAARRVASMGDQGIAKAYELARSDPDSEVRIAAIEGFLSHSLTKDVPTEDELARWQADADPRVREIALTVGLSHSRNSDDQCLRVLRTALSDSDVNVREAAMSEHSPFGFDKKDAVAEAYIAQLTKEPEPDLRASMATRLGEFTFPSVGSVTNETITSMSDALKEAAINDASPGVRATAGHSFMKMFHWLESRNAHIEMKIAKRTKPDLTKQHKAIAELLSRETDERVKSVIRHALAKPENDMLPSLEWSEAPAQPVPPQESQPSGADDF